VLQAKGSSLTQDNIINLAEKVLLNLTETHDGAQTCKKVFFKALFPTQNAILYTDMYTVVVQQFSEKVLSPRKCSPFPPSVLITVDE
jgi:hypothetical protein